jgi:hypothetical protein
LDINPGSLAARAKDLFWLNSQCLKPDRERWCAACGEFCEWFDRMPWYVKEPRKMMLWHGLYYDENDHLVTEGRGVKWRKGYETAAERLAREEEKEMDSGSSPE